jgi:hypothetical protein
MRYLKDSSIDTFVDELRSLEKSAGVKLKIVGGSLMDDTPPYRMVLVNTDGCDWETYGGTIDGVFIE